RCMPGCDWTSVRISTSRKIRRRASRPISKNASRTGKGVEAHGVSKSFSCSDGCWTGPAMKSLTARLEPLFKPKHVAVIGASRSPGKHGNRVIGNIAVHGFEGRVSLINPAGGEIDGAPCFKSIED